MEAGELSQKALGDLIKRARSLDDGGPETIPEKLGYLNNILSLCAGGHFHAAENTILRWLLKAMAGPSLDSERVRRYPLSWAVLGHVFTRMPLLSLAKALADRKFIGVLLQTVKDISRPQDPAGQTGKVPKTVKTADAPSGNDSPNLQKRKRPDPMLYELDSQRQLPGCLMAAEAMFDALGRLLSRLEPDSSNAPQSRRMGSEHVKSLFCSLSGEIMEIIAPLLGICELAVSNQDPVSIADPQESWISTLNKIWDLHLQGQLTAVDVASRLSLPGCSVLGKLTNISGTWDLALDSAVREVWAQELRRFFIKNLIIPARAAFLNRKDLEALRAAIEITSRSAPTCIPVLLDLLLQAPPIVSDASAKKDNEVWIQTAFDILEEPIRRISTSKRSEPMGIMLGLVHDSGAALSLNTLRLICREYALGDQTTDWSLLHRIAQVDADTFVLSQSGVDLLDEVLARTEKSELLSGTDHHHASEFIVCLAETFAKSRDLSGFIKRWFTCLALSEPQMIPKSGRQSIWMIDELGSTVARTLQSSMTTQQLLSLLDWLVQHDGVAHDAALVVILATFAEALTREAFVDAVELKFFKSAFTRKILPATPGTISSAQWRIAKRTLEWSTLQNSEVVWHSTKAELAATLEKDSIFDSGTFEAFKCSTAAWLAFYPGAPCEEESASVTCAFLSRIGSLITWDGVLESLSAMNWNSTPALLQPGCVGLHDYLAWILWGSPHLLQMTATRSRSCPELLLMLIDRLAEGTLNEDALEHLTNGVSAVLFDHECNINDRYLTNGVLGQLSKILERGGEGSWASSKIAARMFLDAPMEVINRDLREQVMLALVTQTCHNPSLAGCLDYSTWKLLVSLMIKLMSRPTYYKDMHMNDLLSLGSFISSRIWTPDQTDQVSDLEDAIELFEELAMVTFRQMTANVSATSTRERDYFLQAIAIFAECPTGPTLPDQIVRILLLKSFILAVEQSTAYRALNAVASMKTLKEKLGLVIHNIVHHACVQWSMAPDHRVPLPLLVAAMQTTPALWPDAILNMLIRSTTKLKLISDTLAAEGVKAGWKIRAILAKHFGADGAATMDMLPFKGPGLIWVNERIPCSLRSGYDDVVEYVDVVIRNADEGVRMQYLHNLVYGLKVEPDPVPRIIAIHRIIQQVDRTLPTTQTDGVFDLATAHSELCGQLILARSIPEFVLLAQTTHLLLSEKASSMTQWNAEVTMANVSKIAAKVPTSPAFKAAPKTYEWLCRLVEVIIKLHRLRLEGHFHVLVTVLQSLLRCLIHNPYDVPPPQTTTGTATATSTASWAKRAKLYARLLTLVCEPSAASVSRSSHPNALDSATDVARRSAGGHMYLVLLLYVRLQLEQQSAVVVPHAVREALEPGWYAVLDVTPPEVRRIASEALDAGGRVIFREMYKQYSRFGKWSGV